jgi:hypothetical protein
LRFAVSIAFNNLIEVAGWHSFAHLALKNGIAAVMVVVSLAMLWLAHSGRLTAVYLLWVSLGYEVTVALPSLWDHLEPFGLACPSPPSPGSAWSNASSRSWSRPLRAGPAVARLASASTWLLAYGVGRLLGNPGAGSGPGLARAHQLHRRGPRHVLDDGHPTSQELGCYELVELDHGGMGEIWKARHRMLARPVAVAHPARALGRGRRSRAASLVSRFHREAHATAALPVGAHGGAARFRGDSRRSFYYVMDLLDGLDLETLVRRFGPLPPERAIHFLVQACDSLAEAHAVASSTETSSQPT